MSGNNAGKGIAVLVTYGVGVLALYGLLFVNEQQVVAWSRQGGWWFLLPVTIAFVFSIVHGNFTSQFWEMLGIKAK